MPFPTTRLRHGVLWQASPPYCLGRAIPGHDSPLVSVSASAWAARSSRGKGVPKVNRRVTGLISERRNPLLAPGSMDHSVGAGLDRLV